MNTENQEQKPEIGKIHLYTQWLNHFPYSSIEDIGFLIETNLEPESYLLIIHDKEVDRDGNPIEPYVYIILKFKDDRYIGNTAAKLVDTIQHVTILQGNFTISYGSFHEAENAQGEGLFPFYDRPAGYDGFMTQITTD